MSYIKEVKPLNEFVKTLSDTEISIAIAEFKCKRHSQITTATRSLNTAIVDEWVTRHGNKPIPSVIPDSLMIFQKNENNSCKFIMHLL